MEEDSDDSFFEEFFGPHEGTPFRYNFHPSSFEILEFYLVPKLKGEADDYLKDLDVYQYDPEQLPMDNPDCEKDEAYFFVPVKDNLTRTTPNGYWKVSEGFLPIHGQDGAIIGYKNKLKFYSGKDPNGILTDWKMVEYLSRFKVNGNHASFFVCKVRFQVCVPDSEAEASGDESHSSEETETK